MRFELQNLVSNVLNSQPENSGSELTATNLGPKPLIVIEIVRQTIGQVQ